MRIKEFLEDVTGKLSAMRLAALLWIVGVLIVWIIASLKGPDPKLETIPDSVITLIGILITGKVVQRFGEVKMKD
jgi:hypothetical protein